MTGSLALNQTEPESLWRFAARTVGALAVIAALFPSVVHQGGTVRTDIERDFLRRNPETMPFRSDYTLGCQSSPLIHGFSEATLVTDEAASVSLRRSNGLKFGLLSWSMAGLASGVLLLWAARKGNDRAGGSKDGEPAPPAWTTEQIKPNDCDDE